MNQIYHPLVSKNSFQDFRGERRLKGCGIREEVEVGGKISSINRRNARPTSDGLNVRWLRRMSSRGRNEDGRL